MLSIPFFFRYEESESDEEDPGSDRRNNLAQTDNQNQIIHSRMSTKNAHLEKNTTCKEIQTQPDIDEEVTK